MSSESTQARLFTCPTCGAGLTPGEEPSVRCTYCGSSVLVPPEYRKVKPQPVQPPTPQVVIQMPMGTPVVQPTRSAAGLVIGIVFFILLVSGGMFYVFFAASSNATSLIGDVLSTVQPGDVSVIMSTSQSVESTISTQIAGIPGIQSTPAEDAYASLTLEFGGEGTGAGSFEDARGIAVDLDGNIYVSEWSAGRIQKFDPTGKFQYQIDVEPSRNDQTTIYDLAVDYAGKLYAVRAGDILIYNAADGSAAGEIPGVFPNTYYEALDITPSNRLYALHISASTQDLIILDGKGKQLQRINNIVENVDKKAPSLSLSLAVDGAGNVYIINLMANVVYKFDAEGTFLDRIGGPGDAPGQFTSPSAGATDSAGNLYVVDFGDIEIFSADGNPKGSLDWDYTLGSARDVTLDNQGRIYVITTKGKVLQFTPNGS